MDAFWVWYATSPIASWVKAFVALLIATAVGSWATDGAISLDRWQAWVIAALVATLPALTNALNPEDERYGRVGASNDEG